MNVKKIISIMVVLMWMSVVFYFSNQQGEGSGNTSRTVSKIIVNIIDIQKQYTSQQTEELIQIVEPIIRKIAHYTIYAIGGIIIVNCVYQFYNKEKRIIEVSAGIGILYAISDEIHQFVIPGRSGNIKDVIIDSLGILTGMAIFLLTKEIFKKIKYREVE